MASFLGPMVLEDSCEGAGISSFDACLQGQGGEFVGAGWYRFGVVSMLTLGVESNRSLLEARMERDVVV
jgi:hypothetical protein